MTNVIASISALTPSPQRLVGKVEKTKDGMITIEYKKPGQIKTSNKIFGAKDINLIAYMEGSAGFVVAMTNDPVAVQVGEMIVKDGRILVKTEAGTVVVNQGSNYTLNTEAADEDSKEARAAARAAKVKGVKVKDKSEKKSKKSKKDKSEKSEKSSKKEGKKDKGDKKKKKKSKD